MQSELVATSARLATTTDQLAATSDRLAGIVSERYNLRRAYRQLMEQFELLRRRIFIAKAERVDATQLELEFEKTKQKLDALAKRLDGDDAAGSPDDDESTAKDAAAKVAKERIGIEKETVSDTQTVTDELRKERVEVEGEDDVR